MSFWSELRTAIRVVGAVVAAVYGQWGLAAALLSAEASSQAMRTAKNKARDAYNASLKDQQQTIKSATASRTVVYGRTRVGGAIVYAQSTGAKSEYLHLVVALAGHECDAIEEVWFNDVKLPDPDGSGNIVTGVFAKGTVGTATEYATGASITLAHTPTSIKSVMVRGGRGNGAAVTYSLAGNVVTFISDTGGNNKAVVYEYDQAGTPLVRIKKHLGSPSQTADADLVSESGGKWTSAHRLRGICYLYVRLQYDEDVFRSIGVPNISVVLRGKKVWDPRTSATAWSQNAALCLADYLRDSTYGLGATSTEVPDADLITAANVCDATVAIDAGGTTELMYMVNGMLSSDDTALNNKQALEQAMAGQAVWTQGRWLILPGAARTPETDISEVMLADDAISIVPATARRSIFNRIVPTYLEPDQKWAETQAASVTSSYYVTDDGGVDVPLEVTYRMTTGAITAQRLAKIQLDRARQALMVQIACNLSAYDLRPGNEVTLTIGRYGWSAKRFEVLSRSLDIDKRQVILRLQETDPAVYSWNYGMATAHDLTPNTTLPSPYTPPNAITGMSIATGTSHLMIGSDGTIITRGYLTWSQSDNIWVVQGGSIEIESIRADADAGTQWTRHAPAAGSATSAYILPLVDQYLTLARIRPVTNLGRAGAWSYLLFLPIGKSQAPSDVAGAAYTVVPSGAIVSWTLPTDLDWAETEWRVGASWAAGTKVFRGAASQFNLLGYSPGTYQLWGANVDTTGNYSTTPTGLSVVVSSAAVIGSLVAVLTNNNHSVPTDSSGNVTSYTGAASTMSILLGGANDTANWTISKAFTNCAGTVGDASNVATISSLTAAAGYVDFTATRSGWPTQTARFSLSKAGQGANGTRTAILEMYQWAVSAPTTFPSGTSTYTWATGAFTAPATPNGWTLTPGAAVSGQTLWVTRQLYTDTLTSATSSVTWAASSSVASGANGTNGQRVGVLEVYQWATTAPTSYPSGTSTYTWATGVFTAPSIPNGWSLTPGTPSAGQTLWAISVAVSDNLTTSTSTANWTSSTVYAVGAAGSNGLNNALAYIYQRAASAPTLPSASATYTFATGGITGLNNGWTAAIPSGTNPLYVSVATASSTGATDTIAAGEWATPVVMAQDGADGGDGLNAATVYLFQRTTTNVAPSLPSASVTYTFATGATTGVNNGWTRTMPTTGGAYRWVTQASALGAGTTDTIASGEWAAASMLAADGSDATAYWLARSVAAVQQGLSGIFTPSTVTFSAFSATGAGAPAAYAGRFVIATSPDGSTYTTQYTSSSNESSKAYTVPVGTKTMRVRLYQAGGTTVLLDEEVVPVISDGALSPFSPVLWWEFSGGWDGWSATQITGAGNPSSITLTSTGTDPIFRSPSGLAITGALYTKVRARLRRLAGSGWQGDLYYVNGAHGESGSYYKRMAIDPTIGGAWVIVEWDMASLTAGGADWINGTTSQIRLDLGTTATDVFEVDWVAVGRESSSVQDGSIGTPQIIDGAVTTVLTSSVASASVLQASGTPLSAASITFTAEFDCRVLVTVSCVADQSAPSEQWSTYGSITINSVAMSGTDATQMTRNESTTSPYDGKTVTRLLNTTQPAGVTRTYYFSVLGPALSGSRSATVRSVEMKLEAILK